MPYKVLVIDDSPVMRVMLCEMLKSLGHTVVGEADSGASGLRLFKETKPELVTLDISLPDENGLQVLAKLRRADPTARVIIVTGNDQRVIKDQAMALKALGVLCKPFEERELAAMLETAASKAR